MATGAAKNPQVPDTPKFSPAAQVAIARLRVAVGLHLPADVPGQVPFGLGYATPSDNAWIHGGSPTTGFLPNVAVRPLESFNRRVYGLGNRWAKVTGHNTWLR